MADERDQYVTEFVRESESHITTLNNALLDLERSPDDQAAVEEIFRTAHTLKGNCGAMGLNEASKLAHALEDLLEAVRAGDVAVTAERMDAFFEAVDALESVIDEVAATGQPTVEADLQPTIEALRRPLDGDDGAGNRTGGADPGSTAPAVERPTDEEIEAVLEPIDPPADDDVDVYLVRLSIDEGGRADVTNGTLVVQALIDAFDLLGTDPDRKTIDAGDYGDRFDAVFASAVGESAIAAALEPVDEVGDFEIVVVTDELEEPDPTPEATDAGPSPLGPDEDLTGDVSTDEAREMSVDELLGEFDELDDLDALVEEVDDAGEFDDLGDAGSFHDLVDDGDEVDAAADVGDEAEPSTDSAADAGATDDAEVGADDAPAGDESAEAEVPEDDASAVFQELKDEVEMVGFDELQEEIDELDFDEFDDEEEVGMDELLGDDVDPDDPTFLPVDEDDEPAAAEADAVDADATDADAVDADATDADSIDEADAVDEMEAIDEADALESDDAGTDDDVSAVEAPAADAADDADDAEAAANVDAIGTDEPETDTLGEAEEEPAETVASDAYSSVEEPVDEAGDDEAVAEGDVAAGEMEAGESPDAPSEAADEPSPDEVPTAGDSSPGDGDVEGADDAVDAGASDEDADEVEATDDDADETDVADVTGTVDDVTDTADAEGTEAADAESDGVEDVIDADADSVAESDVATDAEEPADEPDTSVEDAPDQAVEGEAVEADSFDSIDELADESTADVDEGLAESLDAELDEEDAFADDDSFGDEAVASSDSFDDEGFADADSLDDGADAEAFDADDLDTVDEFDDEFDADDAAFEYQDEGATDEFDAPSPEAADAFDDGADAFDEADAFDDEADDDEPSLVDHLDDVGIPDIELADRSADAAERETRTDRSQSVRVDEEQIDQLLTLVEGLVTSRVRLRHAVDAGSDHAEIARELDDLEDITSELQETVMDVRLVPLRTVTNRLPRVVRDLARDQEKEVSFEQVGEEVELDRGILDRIGDPLIHLVRNAVDHGIEPPDERESTDKPAEGTVELRAKRERNRVRISVEDDGRGLDPERIRSEAVEAEILTEAEADSLSDEAALDLVFHSGLSTAGEVTDVSGRGVGMDVVRRTIEDLNGSVSIESEPGEGTTVTMELPVTVAIADVLFLERDGEEFGIPIEVVDDVVDAGHVVRSDAAEAAVAGVQGGSAIGFGDASTDSSAPDASADEGAGSDGDPSGASDTDGDQSGEDLPVVDLADALGTASAGGEAPLDGMVVRVRDEVRPVAIHCDEVRGRQEVVVTPYEGFLSDIPGLSGATVRGRGEVVNILDVTTL